MAKKCPEEFNPWPPFVDIFASVILVMLLFLLITIVTIGYYAQFKYKQSYTASVVTKAPVQPEKQTKITPSQNECKRQTKTKKTVENAVSFHKIIEPNFKNAKDSFFSGGKAQGNAVRYASNKNQKEVQNQKFIKKNLQVIVEFKNKDIFLSSKIKREIKLFVGSVNRRSKRAIFTIYVSDPKNMISSTLAKQISLGRVLNVKNIIKSSNVQVKNIRMNLQKEINTNNPFGDIIIRTYIP